MTPGEQIRNLERRVEALAARVAELEGGFAGLVAPIMATFQVTPYQAQMLGPLLKRAQVTVDSFESLLTGIHGEPPAMIKVHILFLRRRLEPFGIAITTLRGVGYAITATNRVRAYRLLRQHGVAI